MLEIARHKVVSAAKSAGIQLKQTCAAEGKTLRRQAGGYAHAKQFKRLKHAVKRQRTILGVVMREVQCDFLRLLGECVGWRVVRVGNTGRRAKRSLARIKTTELRMCRIRRLQIEFCRADHMSQSRVNQQTADSGSACCFSTRQQRHHDQRCLDEPDARHDGWLVRLA